MTTRANQFWQALHMAMGMLLAVGMVRFGYRPGAIVFGAATLLAWRGARWIREDR